MILLIWRVTSEFEQMMLLYSNSAVSGGKWHWVENLLKPVIASAASACFASALFSWPAHVDFLISWVPQDNFSLPCKGQGLSFCLVWDSELSGGANAVFLGPRFCITRVNLALKIQSMSCASHTNFMRFCVSSFLFNFYFYERIQNLKMGQVFSWWKTARIFRIVSRNWIARAHCFENLVSWTYGFLLL